MALNHDEQGFLAGQRLGRDEVSEYLESIRDELRAIRQGLASDSRGAAPKSPGSVPARDRDTLSPVTPGAQGSQHKGVAVRVEVNAAGESDTASPGSRQALTAITPRDGRRGGRLPVATPASPAAAASQRDSRGRFTGSTVATPSARTDEDDGRLSMAVDGMGRRLSDAVQEMGAGTEEADPAVKAFNEVAQPLSRGFGKIAGNGEDRKRERWYRRFWTMLRDSRRENRDDGKRQQRILRNIERKPVGDGSGSMLWRGLMMLMVPIGTLVALMMSLPAALAGAVLGGLRKLLTAIGLGGAAIRIPVPGRGRDGSRRAPRGGAATTSQPQRQGRMPGAAQPGGGSATPSRAGRIGGALKQGARRIPGIGALLGLGFMASDVAASERSDASREEKNVTTGRAIGGGLGGIGGMAGGAAAGAALGSVVPGIGTAVGGVVGAIAGGFFGGSAGEVLGEKAGQWLNRLQDTPIIQGMSDSWHYAADFTSSLWESASDAVSTRWESVTDRWESISTTVKDGWDKAASAITSRWESVTDAMKARWESAVDLAAQGWEALTSALGGVNEWIAEKTGIDVGQAASDAAGWVSDTAVASAEWTADRAGRARDWASERASAAAASASEAASTAWDGVKGAGGWAADVTGLSTVTNWIGDATREAGENRRARHNERAAEPALMAAMAEAGITDVNEQAAFMGQMHHESNGFRSLEESFRYSSADRIMDVSATARRQGREAVEAAMAQGPAAVAELMYGGRMGNTEAGDGYRYRGRGYTQLTGRDNYTAASEALGIDLVNNPDLAADPEVSARVATWYWQNRSGLSEAAQRGDTREVTRLINGGHNGLEDRRNQTDRYLAAARAGELTIPHEAVAADATEPGRPVVASAPAGPTTRTDRLATLGPAISLPPVGTTPRPAPAIAVPRTPAVAEAPAVSVPMSHGGKQDSQRAHPGQRYEDVSRDVSDRRIAHIVTGAYSGMS